MHTILIAEDDITSVENLKKALREKGLDVLTTNNGIEAMRLIKEKEPAVLLLDINLPAISGLRLLEEVKKISPQTKVIMMTGSFDSNTEKQARDLGAHAFLKKPFMVEILFKLLSDLGIIT